MRIIAAAALALVASAALAQGPADGELRPQAPTPPSRHPETGPDVGGDARATVVPAVPSSSAPPANRNRRADERCAELGGALREQCLLEQQGAAAGATAPPQPRTAPPPQNPH